MNDFGTEFEQKGVIGGDILYIAMHALCNKKQSITFTGHLKYALHMGRGNSVDVRLPQ